MILDVEARSYVLARRVGEDVIGERLSLDAACHEQERQADADACE